MLQKLLQRLNKKPVLTIEQALIESAKRQDSQKVVVDRDQLFYLIEQVKSSKQERKDFLYLVQLAQTIEQATTEAKAIVPEIKQQSGKQLLFFALQNQDRLKSIWNAINIILKSPYHIQQIKNIIQKYGQ